MDNITRFLQKWRVRLGHLFVLVLLIVAAPNLRAAAAGTVLVLIGAGLRVLSAGYIEKDEVLSLRGPYAHVRNPLYVGSFVMYLGFCFASGRPLIVVAYLPFFFCIYFATIFREEAFLTTKFGDRFAEYVRRVPRFLPRPTPAYKGGRGVFAWSQVWANREYEGLIAAIVILSLLWVEAALKFSPIALFHK